MKAAFLSATGEVDESHGRAVALAVSFIVFHLASRHLSSLFWVVLRDWSQGPCGQAGARFLPKTTVAAEGHSGLRRRGSPRGEEKQGREERARSSVARMERGREGRRGGGGGGLVHAPRRPRTGFKDAAVGDDAEDMMDDVHNSRLRERTKKDGSGVSGGHGVATSIVGPSSRNKRKRQGSQEIQVHARNSPADEVEETTEDTEMGVSEDDDDPPPPIIPRRPGKPRPQSKFAEDGIAVDLPAVPRKARTAMGKRPQEAASASVSESPGHGAGAVAASTPAPSSTPSSSSIASLKPGRRTKPSGSKPRGHKLAKVSTPSLVSEQEVEVAEALFDLARMCTQPPPSASAVEPKKEPRASVNDVKSEAKQEPKVGGSSLPPHAPNGHSAVPSGTSAVVASVAGGSVRSNSPGVASAASPAPSPPAAAAASVADGSKKKRPKVRTRTEEGVVVQSRMGPSPASAAGSVVAPVKDADKVKVEGSVSVPVGAVAVAPNVSGPAMVASGAGVASSGIVGLPSAVPGVPVGVSVGRVEKVVVDKKGVPSEKKIGVVVGKAELSISNSVEKRVSGSPVREKKPVSGESAVVAAPADVPSAASPSLGVGAVSTKMEVDKRSPEAAAGPSDVDHVSKRDIDLMVAPSKAVGLSSVEKDGYSVEGDVGAASEKRQLDASSVSVSEDRIRAERDREREEKERSEMERGRERERERELERERVERDRRREAESARELAKEAVKEREREKERERAELSKAGMAMQRSGKSGKAENGRAPKASERAGSVPASGASTMLGSVGPGVGSVGAGVGGNVAVLPMSVGMLSWPAGMAGGLGYFPGAAAVSSAAVEESSPAAQVSPYMMGGRGTWKRCAMHVYIARFIDMQQQVNRHQNFFASGSQAYPKSYNLNVPLAPSESLFGGGGGGGSVGIVGGASASGSTGVSGSVSATLEATERGLNAAAMAAAAAASMQGVKERASYSSMDMVSRKSPGQHQGSGPGAPSLSLQSGAMFGFPSAGSGSPSGGVVGGVSGGGGGGGAMGGTNLNLPPGPGPGVALSSGGGSSSALVLGPGGPVGGLSSVGSGGAAASASAALQQAQHALMHQALMHQAQSGSFPFAQFPPHFGPATFSGPAPHMGAQQAAAQFYAGGPYFTQHLVPPSQLQGVPPSGSAGGGPVSKLQQQQQQQGGSRSFGGGVGVPPQSPSHSALQGGSHAVGRSGDRESSALGENGSSGEGKFRGSALGVGGSGASEYNLMSGLGKQSKSRESVPSLGSQGVSPVQLQGPGPHQHHYHGGGGGAHLGGHGVGKVPEGGSSQGFSVNMNMAAAMNSRGASVGPGPLGLAPVAAVMAPQGHAMIQSMSESGRVHPQGGGSGHAHAQMGGGAGHSSMMQQGHQQLMQLQQAQQQHFQAQAQAQQSQLQQQHLQQQSIQGQQLQQQRGAPNARSSAGVGVEDGRGGSDASYSSGVGRVREREAAEDRKLQGKRVSSSGGASPLSRDVEGGGGMQSTSGGVGGVSRSVGTTLNLMAPINSGMGVRSGGPSGVALSVGTPMQAQAQVQAGAMPGSKSVVGRPKGSGGPGPGPVPSGGSVSGGPHMVGTQASFSERVPAVSGGSVGVGGKASPPRGLSLGGQNMVPGPVGRPGPVGQHAGAKASPSPSGRAALVSGATATPTAPGTNLQAVLASAMAKTPQSQQPPRSSGNASANANSNAGATAGSSARPGAGPAGPPASSGAAPLSSPAPPAKSSGSNPAKSSSSGKSSFPASGKGGAGGGGGKRASSPSSGGHAPSILGPSPLAQNMPSKSSQQPQVQMQGPGQWEGQLAPPHLLPQQQFQQHQHQQMMRQQQQMMQQQMFQQHHQQQQHQLQQSPHIQGSQSGPPHLQAPKQASHQQQGGHQPPPPPPGPSAQAQQVSINQQNQQQVAHAHLQQQASQPQQQFVGPSGNGSLSFSSGVSMGAGNSGSGGGVGVGRSSYSESSGGALNVRPLQSVKPSGSGSNPGLNGVGQRGGVPGAGPVFLQQFGPSVSVSSGQQQSGSPRGGNASGYSQSQGNAISGAGGRSGDGKSFPDGGQEQVNGVRMAPGSAQARGVAPMAASPGAPGSSQRAPSGGSGHGPGPGPGPGPSGVAGPTKAGGGVQYTGFGDGQLRPGMMSNSGSVSGSVGGMSGGGTNVQSVGNGRPGFSGGSLHVGVSGQGQIPAASSLAMTGPAVVPSGPAAVLGPQATISVVQQ